MFESIAIFLGTVLGFAVGVPLALGVLGFAVLSMALASAVTRRDEDVDQRGSLARA